MDALNAQFRKEQSPLVFNELCRASRQPLSKESDGVRELISLIESKGIKIDGVKFMNALSLANYLTAQATKDEIIPLLLTTNKKASTNFIKNHLNSSVFSSDSFKYKVQKTVEQGCARSKLFRDLCVTTFGKISSGSSVISAQLSTLVGGNSNHMSFKEGYWPNSKGESIVLTCDRDNVFQNSFFHSSATEKRTETGTFAALFDDIYIPYHEMGHSSSAIFFGLTTCFDIDDTIRLITALSNNLTFDEEALNEFLEHLKAAPQEMNVRERYIRSLKVIYDHGQSLDELKAEIAQLGASNEGIVRLLHLNSVEIFQILGLALVKNGDENILFINPLCDLALASEQGLPIRADHVGFALNPEKKEYSFLLPKKLFVNHSINLDFYGAMLKVFGSSMQQYMMKIMYGDNLPHALMMEWGLVKTCIVLQYLYNMLHTQASTAIVQQN